MAGRKPKLNKKFISELCKLVIGGNYIKTAVQHLGVSESVFYRWLQEAQKSIAKVEDLERKKQSNKKYLPTAEEKINPKDNLLVQLVQSVQQARATSEINLMKRIELASFSDWKAAHTMLKIRNRQLYDENYDIVIDDDTNKVRKMPVLQPVSVDQLKIQEMENEENKFIEHSEREEDIFDV